MDSTNLGILLYTNLGVLFSFLQVRMDVNGVMLGFSKLKAMGWRLDRSDSLSRIVDTLSYLEASILGKEHRIEENEVFFFCSASILGSSWLLLGLVLAGLCPILDARRQQRHQVSHYYND